MGYSNPERELFDSAIHLQFLSQSLLRRCSSRSVVRRGVRGEAHSHGEPRRIRSRPKNKQGPQGFVAPPEVPAGVSSPWPRALPALLPIPDREFLARAIAEQ